MKKIAAFLFIVFLLFPLIAGCVTDTHKSNDGNQSTVSDVSNIDENTEKIGLPDKNWGDLTLTVLSVSTGRHGFGTVQFAPIEEMENNIINDTVDYRNRLIEEKYGIKIVTVQESYPKDKVAEIIQTDVSDYDMICDGVTWMAQHVLSDYFWCIDNLSDGNVTSYIDLSKSWWDSRFNENLSLLDKHFLVAGDLIITDDDYTYCTVFSKSLAEEKQLGNLYDLVYDGDWTLDKYRELAIAARQADEYGNYNLKSVWGSLAHNYAGTILLNGSGLSLVEKDDNGIPAVTANSVKAHSVFAKVFDILGDEKISLLADGFEGGWGEVTKIFMDNRGLLYNTTISSLTGLRKTDEVLKVTYGVLPIPKADKDQKEYYNAVNVYQSSVIGIPKTNRDNFEATTFALEALGYYSKYAENSLNKAYYKTTLNLQNLDNSDDVKMLDIILSSRLYDVGSIFNFGGVIGLASKSVSKGDNTYESDFRAIEDIINGAIETALIKYDEMS